MSRNVTVALNTQQQGELMPSLTHLVRTQLGLSEHEAGSIVVETLGRLTPDMALSEMTVLKTLSEEMASYATDPRAYEARSTATRYDILAFHPDPPADLGHPSPDLAELLDAPADVPLRADPIEPWSAFAHAIDGHDIAQRLGWRLGELVQGMEHRYERTGEWRGSLLDLRLVLFYKARQLGYWGVGLEAAGEGYARAIESLLAAIVAHHRETPDRGTH